MILYQKMSASFLLLLILTAIAVAQTEKIDTRTGHTASVNVIAFSPNGKLLASGSEDKTIKFWSVADGKEIRTIITKDSVETLAFRPDGKLLASSSKYSSNGVVFWDVVTGKEVRRIESESCESLAFSPDGKLLACNTDFDGVKLFDVETSEETQTFDKAKSPMVFSFDGKELITASGDDLVRIWDVETGERLRTFEDVGSVKSIVASRNGRYVACLNSEKDSSEDKETLNVFDLKAGRKVQGLTGEEDDKIKPKTIAFSPDSKTIAFGLSPSYTESNVAIRIVNIQTGEIEAEIGNSKEILADGQLIFSPDGKTLASFVEEIFNDNRDIYLWDVENQELLFELLGHSIDAKYIGFTQDGKRLLSITHDGTALWWDVSTGKLQQLVQLPKELFDGSVSNAQTLSPDSKVLLNSETDYADLTSEYQFIDTSTGKILLKYKIPAGSPSLHKCFPAFSPDGKLIAGTNGNDVITLLDAKTGKEVRKITLNELPKGDGLKQVLFSRDGKLLIGYGEKWIRVFDVATGKQLKTIPLELTCDAVTISPNGKQLALMLRNKDYSKWVYNIIDWATNTKQNSLHAAGVLISALPAFTPDGKFITTFSNDGGITLNSVTTGKEYKKFPLPESNGSVISMVFSSDGKYLAVGTTQGVILIDLVTGKASPSLA